MNKDQVQEALLNLSGDDIRQINDGYHSFEELYEFRKMYNAALFNEWGNSKLVVSGAVVETEIGMTYPGVQFKRVVKYDVHKSWRHYDGELCFGGGWFIVVAVLPSGQISNHYRADDWDLFKVPEVEKALFPFDGHIPQDVLERLKSIL